MEITAYGDEVLLISASVSNMWDISAKFVHGGIVYNIFVWTNDRDGGESVVRRVVEGMR